MTKFENIGKYILGSLLAVTSLAACSKDAELEEETPGEYPVVKTQFAITVPLAEKTSRQPKEYVQQGDHPDFKGLDHIWMVPFKQRWTTANSQPIYRERLIALPSTTQYTDPNAHVNVYDNVIVPIGTQQFLFYASIYQQMIGLNTSLFQVGALRSTLQQRMSTIDDIRFGLEHCFLGDMRNPQDSWYQHAQILIDAVNAVFTQLKTWKGSKIKARQEMYLNFRRMEAGSAYMIREALLALYNELKTNSELQGEESPGEATLAEVEASIFEGNSALFIRDQFQWKQEHVGTGLSQYPIPFYLPIGAVQIKYNKKTDQMMYSNLDKSPLPYAVNIMDICYPPTLMYFAHTDLAVKDEKLSSWNNIWTNPDFSQWGDEVQLSTQTLALKKKVQYGVASLEAKFMCKSSQLKHNARDPIEVPEEGFPVTGILIGGQPKEVGWNFESVSNDPNQFHRIVFDRMHNVKDISDPNKRYVSGITAKYNSWSGPNYTLLLKNNPGEEVGVLVELQNTSGQVIHGIDNGLIPVGAPFYLMAVLKPDEQIEIDNGSSQPILVDHPSLFIPDVTTQVQFNISSLTHAYLTIPDLRTTQMQVGMYVDLTWKKSRPVQANIGE